MLLWERSLECSAGGCSNVALHFGASLVSPWAMEILSMFSPQDHFQKPFWSSSAVKAVGFFSACSWRDAVPACSCTNT